MNLTNTLIISVIGLIAPLNTFSQQEPRSAFFWNQYMHTNPAMTGAIYKHHANTQWRNQWTKINGAPTVLWANYAAKLENINSGVGVSYEYNVTGFNRQHTALVSYAYHIPIKKMFLSLGVSAGVWSTQFDKKGLVFPQSQNDPLLPSKQTIFQGDFGIAFRGEKWNTGFSATHLSGYFVKASNGMYHTTPQYWLFGDYAFGLGQNWKLTPRIQVGTDFLKYFSTLALITSYKNWWFGASALNLTDRRGFELGPMIGYDIMGKFRVGYTYEFGINTHMSHAMKNNATHEIILSYQLK